VDYKCIFEPARKLFYTRVMRRASFFALLDTFLESMPQVILQMCIVIALSQASKHHRETSLIPDALFA